MDDVNKYNEIFKIQQIDEEAFPLLQKEDLVAMGITLLGPQVKLWNKIKNYKQCNK